jgi:hypothetical protein
MNDVPSMPQRPAQATIAAAVAELETALTRTRVEDEPPPQPGG